MCIHFSYKSPRRESLWVPIIHLPELQAVYGLVLVQQSFLEVE